VRSLDGSFDSASGSPDGSLAVLFAFDPPAPGLRFVRAGAGSTVELPDGEVGVSPSGGAVLVQTTDAAGESVLLAPAP
jgi:hypothetical protein